MGKKRRHNNRSAAGQGGGLMTTAPVQPSPRHFQLLSRAGFPWVIVFILAVGATLRLWGITERRFVDPDTAGHHMGGEAYRLTWDWHHDGIAKTTPLLDYLDQRMGHMAVAKFDNGKPLNLIIRAAAIFTFGRHSLLAHSVLDVLFALLASGLMLHWCHRNLGPRIAVLAGCLWLLNGAHFQDTGRGYDYSAMMLFGTLAWLAFMRRGGGRIYLWTFLAGLSLGAGITYHYSFFNYFPLLLVFVLLFRNPAGIKGKLLEIAVFVAGYAVFPLAIMTWYQWLSWVTDTPWRWGILSPLFQQGNTFGDMRIGVQYIPNAWFMWEFLNGYLFMFLVFAGLVAVAVRHVRQYGWRWSICDDPLFIINGVVCYGLLIWGIYSTIEARVQTPEVMTWPVAAAVGVHYSTRFVSDRLLKGRALAVIQVVAVAAVMLEQWHHTAPLVKMGSGLLKTMNVISAAGKTAMGEGAYWGMWPCTDRPKKPWEPTPPLTRWECLDDHIGVNKYDYFYAQYSRIMTHMVMYPGAGPQLMLDTYNRLCARAMPVWRFEFGAPINFRLECMNMGWTRQTMSLEEWRKHHPQPTPYDALIERQPYIDVFKAEDAVSAFHESRVSLLAQLLVLNQTNREQFRQIVPRYGAFLQYNSTNATVMAEAQQAATSMLNRGGSQR